MKYEIMFIVRPDMEESAQKDLLKTYDKLLTDNGATIDSFKELGQKELAYEIKGNKSCGNEKKTISSEAITPNWKRRK